MALRRLLQEWGYEAAEARTGPEGLDTARQFRPDIVLCDLDLPGMDGYAVAAALRRDPALAAARLIAISGYGLEEDRRHSREAGFEHFLAKPLDFVALRKLVAAMPQVN
jgi:two-component system CheB/CheR fusion protein